MKEAEWEHVSVVSNYARSGGCRWVCNYCQLYSSGSPQRIRHHLACLRGAGIGHCDKVPLAVKTWAAERCQLKDKRPPRPPAADLPPAPDAIVAMEGSSPVEPPPLREGLDENDAWNESEGSDPPDGVPKKEEFLDADAAVRQFLLANAVTVPMSAVESSYFRRMVEAVCRAGEDYPDVAADGERALDDEYEDLKRKCGNLAKTWGKYGCTIAMDGWSSVGDGSGSTLINVVATSINGSIFLKAVDVSRAEKNAEMLFKVVQSSIEEIGREKVVQVVTDNAENCIGMGRLLEEQYPEIVYGRCVCHCLDLLLEDIGRLDWVSPLLDEAKHLVDFIDKDARVLKWFEKQAGHEFVHPAAMTRFGYMFVCMSQLVHDRYPLRRLVLSEKWIRSSYRSSDDGKRFESAIENSDFFRDLEELLEIIDPVTSVFNLADRPGAAMGLIYECMQRMIDGLNGIRDTALKAAEVARVENDAAREQKEQARVVKVDSIAELVLECRENQPARWKLSRNALHGAGRVLHPLWLDPINDDVPSEALVDCRRYIGSYAGDDAALEGRLLDQLVEFLRGTILDDDRIASSRKWKLEGVKWWETFGAALPDLKRLAIRVLSQTASASPCARNWSTSNLFRTKKRARSLGENTHKVMYVHANLRLSEDALVKFVEVDLDQVKVEPQWERLLKMESRFDALDEAIALHSYQEVVAADAWYEEDEDDSLSDGEGRED